jgi:hypothetical protein
VGVWYGRCPYMWAASGGLAEVFTHNFEHNPVPDEPSMVAAVPKGLKVGGWSAHHCRARLLEAQFWNGLTDEQLNGIWFADESKMTFREHKNRAIDIKWVYRGQASGANWYEKPRWPGQINLFLLQSIHGIEYSDIYQKNMGLAKYKSYLPDIGAIIRDTPHDFSYYLHDNAWRGTQPEAELNLHIGNDKWTQYPGKPCTKPHATLKTPVRGIACRVPKINCTCTFPDGPIHAPFNPKMNLVENTFAEIDRQLTRNKIADEKRGRKWPLKDSSTKRVFWRKELEKAIRQVDDNKAFFRHQYSTLRKRCRAFIASSGKRLRTSKW